MCRCINAENAVVDFRPNVFFDERDPFAEVCASGHEIFLCYWWLTETWEEFVKQVVKLNWPLAENLPIGGDPYVWEGMVKGKPATDCIMPIDDLGEEADFKLATEDIPKWIPNSQTS